MRLTRGLGKLIGAVAVAGSLATVASGCAASGAAPLGASSLAVAAVAAKAPAARVAAAAASPEVTATASATTAAAKSAAATSVAATKAAATAKAGPSAADASPAAAVTAAVPAVGNPSGTVAVPAAARAVSTAHPNHVIGRGTPASCTSAAVVKAVAEGGVITFSCGPKPVTITMTATAKVINTSHRVVLDGGGKVTLSGGGKVRILYMNTCDPKQVWTTAVCYEQEWPQLVVQNLTFKNAYSSMRQTPTSTPWYGGGAIFDEGGQLKVVNSAFIDNRCYATGLDLSGGAIRAYAMYQAVPTYLTHDTFTGNTCANGGAVGGLHANFDVINTLMTDNKATGWGANPAPAGTPGGGSGGAIFTDGVGFNLLIDGTRISDNNAREGGGAIFYTDHFSPGTLTIEYSTLHHNPSGVFQNAPGIYYSVENNVIPPIEIHSTVN